MMRRPAARRIARALHDARATAAGEAPSGVDWSAGDDLSRRVDPYLYWAEQTRFVTYARAADKRLSAAFELHRQQDGPAFGAWLQSVDGRSWIDVAPHWIGALAGGTTKFFTGRFRVAGFSDCPMLAQIRRLKVGFVGAHQPQALPAFDATPADPQPPLKPDPGSACVIGIIDFGCSFAHSHFCREEKSQRWATRVTHLWQQECPDERLPQASPAAARNLWQPCSDFGYGRETTKPALDRLIADACTQIGHRDSSAAVGNAAVERLCYEWATMAQMLEGDRPAPHGTQVMDVAAGLGFAHPGSAAANDAASHADIMFVQMPKPAVVDLSSGWLAVHVLDAVSYLIDRAAGRPLVVNLSFGSFAGSHDGQSLLEEALDSLVGDTVEIVLAAGNIAGLKVHAEAVIAPKTTASFTWHVTAGDSTQNFLELWYQAPSAGAAPVPPGITLSHPDLQAPLTLAGAGAVALRLSAEPDAMPVVGLVHVPRSDAGGPDGMALISMAPTMTPGLELPDWPVRAPHGRWRVTVQNDSGQPLTCHAWVERDEPGRVPVSRAPQSTLEAISGERFQITDNMTLSGQCGGGAVTVVGAYRLHARTRSPAVDTGFGPSRRAGGRAGPDLMAPGSQEIRGIDCGFSVAACFSGTSIYSLGTSLAAPWVARQLLNEFDKLAPARSKKKGRPTLLRPLLNAQDPQWGRGHVPPAGGRQAGQP